MNLDGMVKLQKMTIINSYKLKKFSIYKKKNKTESVPTFINYIIQKSNHF